MPDITKLARLIDGLPRNVDLTTETLVVASVKVGAGQTLLSQVILDNLVALQTGSDALALHHHDGRYPTDIELASTTLGSAGASLIGVFGAPVNYVPATGDVQAHLVAIDSALATAGSSEMSDALFAIFDAGDSTKRIMFQAENITPASTRVINMPDANVNLGDVNLAVLTNGTRPFTADQSMGGYVLTGLANGGASGSDAVTYAQLQAVQSIIQNFEWKESVISTLVTPPLTPAVGARYRVGIAATGAWTGQDNKIAEWDGVAWVFTTPTLGTFVSSDDSPNLLLYWGGSSWSEKYFESTTASTGLVRVGFDVRLDTSSAGSGLGFSSGVLSVNVDGVTIEIDADILRVKASGISSNELAAGSVISAKINTTNAVAADFFLKTNALGILSWAPAVEGPASATDEALARFDGTSGKLIQNSTATLSDAGLLTVSGLTSNGPITYSDIVGTSFSVATGTLFVRTSVPGEFPISQLVGNPNAVSGVFSRLDYRFNDGTTNRAMSRVDYTATSATAATAAANYLMSLSNSAGTLNRAAVIRMDTSNTFFGYLSGSNSDTAGVFCAGFGQQALSALTTGGQNTAVGYAAGDTITTGVANTFVGYDADVTSSATSSFAVVIGANSRATGQSVAIGYSVRGGSGFDTVLLGYLAGNNAATSTGTSVIGIGSNVLDSWTSAAQCIAIGSSALAALTTGGRNIAIGHQAANTLVDGVDNTVIGYIAAVAASNTIEGTAIGREAKAATRSVSMGYGAAFAHTTATYSTAIGYRAGDTVTTGTGNTFVGADADSTDASSTNATVIGTDAIANTQSVAVGALARAGTGTKNVFVGYSAGNPSSISTGTDNIGLGSAAFSAITSASQSVAIGSSALAAVTTGGLNVAIGHQAGNTMTTGSSNTLIGHDADVVSATDAFATAFGAAAIASGFSVAIGYAARSGSGSNNVIVGFSAGNDAATSTALNLTGVGAGALSDITLGNDNTAVGRNSLGKTTAGVSNTAVGFGSGENTLGSSYNSFFGALASSSNNVLYATALGFNAFAYGSGATAVGGGAQASSQDTVIGLSSGHALSGGYNTVVGYLSGAGLSGGGSYNTLLGSGAEVVGAITGATALGANASVAQSNTVSIGASNARAVIGATSAGAHLDVVATVGTGDIVQFRVVGLLNQTSNMVEVRSSANVLLTAISNVGTLSTNTINLAGLGTGAAGYIDILAGTAPTVPAAGHSRLFSLTQSDLSFIGSPGFVAKLDFVSLTANRAFAFPNFAGTVLVGGAQTTTATAGSASALPATPEGYVTISLGGTNYRVPYYL